MVFECLGGKQGGLASFCLEILTENLAGLVNDVFDIDAAIQPPLPFPIRHNQRTALHNVLSFARMSLIFDDIKINALDAFYLFEHLIALFLLEAASSASAMRIHPQPAQPEQIIQTYNRTFRRVCRLLNPYGEQRVQVIHRQF